MESNNSCNKFFSQKPRQKRFDLELAVGGSVSEALNFVEFIDRLGACNKMKRVEVA